MCDQTENNLKNDNSKVQGSTDNEGSAKAGRSMMVAVVMIMIFIMVMMGFPTFRMGVIHVAGLLFGRSTHTVLWLFVAVVLLDMTVPVVHVRIVRVLVGQWRVMVPMAVNFAR